MTKLPCLVVAAAYQCCFAGELNIHVRSGGGDSHSGLCQSGQSGFVPCDWVVEICCSSLWCRSQRRGDLDAVGINSSSSGFSRDTKAAFLLTIDMSSVIAICTIQFVVVLKWGHVFGCEQCVLAQDSRTKCE